MIRPRVRRSFQLRAYHDCPSPGELTIVPSWEWAVIHADGEWSPYIVDSYPLHEFDRAFALAESLVGQEVCS